MIQTSLRMYYRTVFWVWDLKRDLFWVIFFMSFFRTFIFSKKKKPNFYLTTFSGRFSFSQPIHCHSNMRTYMFSLNISTSLENYKCLISQQEVRMVRLGTSHWYKGAGPVKRLSLGGSYSLSMTAIWGPIFHTHHQQRSESSRGTKLKNGCLRDYLAILKGPVAIYKIKITPTVP